MGIRFILVYCDILCIVLCFFLRFSIVFLRVLVLFLLVVFGPSPWKPVPDGGVRPCNRWEQAFCVCLVCFVFMRVSSPFALFCA